MGSRGPAPKRDSQRAGHNAKSERADKAIVCGSFTTPGPSPDWHPRAVQTWEAFTNSGQTQYWEPSDYLMLVVACDNLTSHYTMARPSAEMFKHTWDILRALGATEADRRRQRIEVERKGGEDAADGGEATDDIRARFAALSGG